MKQCKLCNNCSILRETTPAVILVESVVASTTPCCMTHVMVRAAVPTPLFQIPHLKKIQLLWALIPLIPSVTTVPDPWEKNQYYLHSRFKLWAREKQLFCRHSVCSLVCHIKISHQYKQHKHSQASWHQHIHGVLLKRLTSFCDSKVLGFEVTPLPTGSDYNRDWIIPAKSSEPQLLNENFGLEEML